MKTAIAIRHVAFEDLGSLLPVLQDHGFSVAYHDAGVDDPGDPALRNADLLIALGGPISSNDVADYPFLAGEIDAIKSRLTAKRPTLGICLGAQLMARALGAQVRPMPSVEIGWAAVTLSEAGENSPLRQLRNIPVLHWHGETFDLPEGATLLASTAACRHQAFAIGRHALGLQFHPEITRARMEQWLIGYPGELRAAEINATELRDETARWSEGVAKGARDLFSEWLKGI